MLLQQRRLMQDRQQPAKDKAQTGCAVLFHGKRALSHSRRIQSRGSLKNTPCWSSLTTEKLRVCVAYRIFNQKWFHAVLPLSQEKHTPACGLHIKAGSFIKHVSLLLRYKRLVSRTWLKN
ncbi:hypothetical protein CEXT_376871 [Caerostris extrusa]|uniref:Uncharacterized protein n=1 Tax=Caerostris extrusa TaxID=172846 RepID=A0AAV4MJS4_CAEEX|nr:hypothetical protein CEXT_376871 [Caerostris extrusa]